MLTSSRWRVPAACAAAAGLYLGIFLAQGKPALALATSGIMLAYGAVLLLLRRRSDAAAVLSEYRTDERREQIGLRAAQLSSSPQPWRPSTCRIDAVPNGPRLPQLLLRQPASRRSRRR